ncbi:sorting nexin-12 isoform X1 [Carassius gibelio]|uniref:sorting nexin-12 isoform X1 n=1 Tax=Carassius gibelio TaxID=101364 RepID=UPI00227975CB|nr:sorting nexin-12 isoform X1 [Carassius gibelio]
MSEATVADTRRLNSKPQDLTDAYGPPSNFLEIDVYDPQTIGVGRNRFTTYEVRMKTNLPIFKMKESCVRRRYSDFEWLKNELERDSKIVVPPLPGKALKRQLPFRGDEGIFEESFIEERRAGLEQFINRIAGHPLAQNERCLHMFLQEESIDRNYIPGKVLVNPPPCPGPVCSTSSFCTSVKAFHSCCPSYSVYISILYSNSYKSRIYTSCTLFVKRHILFC